MTAGVMCSCFISYPGFIRYHMAHLRSILSAVKSGFRRIGLPKSPNGLSAPSSTKGLAIEAVKVTLSSRIDARCPILHPASGFAAEPDWHFLSETSRNSSTRSDNATRREYYECLAEKQRSQALRSSSLQSDSVQEGSKQTIFPLGDDSELSTQEAVSKEKRESTGGSTSGNNSRYSNTLPTGYWDIMSFFRTKTRSSSGPTNKHSKSDDSAV